MQQIPLRAVRRIGTFVIAFAVGVWVCDRWMTPATAAVDAPTTAPSTRPATTRVATTRAAATGPTLSPEVAAIAQRVRVAYAKRPLRLRATLTTDFDVAGLEKRDTVAITAAAADATHFLHRSGGELTVAGNGESVHVLDVAQNVYWKTSLGDVATPPEDVRALLAQQNPALAIAAAGDVASVIAPSPGAKVERVADETKSGVLTTLADGTTVRFAFTPDDTIASVQWDYAELLRQRGATDIKRAIATLTYDQQSLGDGDLPADALDFSLPSGAREASPSSREELLSDASGVDDPAAALTGRDAPAVALNDLEGRLVNVVGGADAPVDTVIVLDFWATWCGPCVASLPRLNELAGKYKDRGVQVYALNQAEAADAVRQFVREKKLDHLNVLLDPMQEVAKAYHVSGIPQTVVIGREGKVRKVLVGYSPANDKALDLAVQDALE